ncbi:DNA-3-methyladenine glycosylase family protein [Aeribacillus alveayuensis]|jgi:DNA-3-methyladenine glycosylase II
MWKEQVEATPPYDFDQVLEMLALDPLNKVNIEKRTIDVPLYDRLGNPFVVTVQATGTKEEPSFIVTGMNEGQKEHAMSELVRIFHWDRSLKVIQEHFLQTNLAKLFREHEGTPLILDFHVYNCLMKCIIHQQLNLSFAYQLSTSFVNTFGTTIDGVKFYPKPEVVAELNYDDLRSLKFSRRKAEYVIDTSRLIAEGKLSLEKLHDMNDQEVMNKLVKVRGIGPWTVQNVLMFGLGRSNLFPVADIGLQNAVKKYFNLERKPTKEEMEKYSREWSPYLSYASLYLWRSIEKKRRETT